MSNETKLTVGNSSSLFLALFSQVQTEIDTPGEWQADAQVTRFKKIKNEEIKNSSIGGI